MIPGTEGAKQPFWSPDGKSVGFFARRKLMKVELAGGAPVVVADAVDGRDGTWSRSGVIVFSPDLVGSSLSKVSDVGRQVERATVLDIEKSDNSHRWPVFLPDGVHFFYFNRSPIDERRGVYLGRVDRPASKPDAPLFHSESEAVFAPLPGQGGASFTLRTVASRYGGSTWRALRSLATRRPSTLELAATPRIIQRC